jgi:hypothetical protein
MEDVANLLEQHQQAVTGLLLGLLSAMVSWAFARAVKWLRSDGASVKQRALLEQLVKRLQDQTREWREVPTGNGYPPELHEFNSDGILVAALNIHTGNIVLSGDWIEGLLTKRQRKDVWRAFAARLQKVREAKVEQALTQAIVQASRL